MRKVPRGKEAAPQGLAAKKKGSTELEAARAHYKAPFDPTSGSYEFVVYKAADVKARLDELFHGKCAYCETFYASSAPVDIEHFRPKGAVEGVADHTGYWWLAMAWENLLPSCIDCNRRRKQVTPKPSGSLVVLDKDARFPGSKVILTGKKDLFPIAPSGVRAAKEGDPLEAEGALLLNPCDDDPSQHLMHHVDPALVIGLMLPRPEAAGGIVSLPAAMPSPADVAAGATATNVSIRGAVSIQVYGLNRLGLVQDRTRVLRRLEFLEMLVIDLAKLIQDLEVKTDADVVAAVRKLETLKQRTLAEIKEMASPKAPYASMVQAWIVAMKARFAE